MALVNRKPAQSDGPRIPELMRQMRVDQWINLPMTTVDRMMRSHPLEEVRIYFCILRFSLGYGFEHAVRVIFSNRSDTPNRIDGPIRNTDIAEHTGIDERNVHSKVLRMISDGWLKKEADDRIRITFRSNEFNDLVKKIHPHAWVFVVSRNAEQFRKEWEAIQTEKATAAERLQEEYQQKEEEVKTRYNASLQRKALPEGVTPEKGKIMVEVQPK